MFAHVGGNQISAGSGAVVVKGPSVVGSSVASAMAAFADRELDGFAAWMN